MAAPIDGHRLELPFHLVDHNNNREVFTRKK